MRNVRVLDGNTIGLLEEGASGEVLSPIFDMIRDLMPERCACTNKMPIICWEQWIKGLTLSEIIWVADQ